jgi:two-component system, NarL family, sensor histidine kinase UhpB
MKQLLNCLFFITIWYSPCKAQVTTLDSLKKEIAKAREDTSKVKLYLLAGKEVIYQNPNEAIVYYLQGVKLSAKINYIQGAGICFLSLGNAYSFLSKTDSTFLYMDSALLYLRQLNNATYLANFFGNRADTYVQISNFKKALQDCDTATRYIEIGGTKLQLAFIYNIRADIYWHLKQYQLNKEYVDKALEIHQETGNIRMVGQAYSDKADWYDVYKKFDTAVIFYKKAIYIADSIHDESNLSRYYGSLSDTYLHMNKKNEAASSALQSLKYAQEEDNPVQEAFVHTLLCKIYTQQNNSKAAIRHGRQGHYMAMKEIDFPLQQSSAAALAEAFRKSGSIDSAYHYLQISKDLNDSLITKNFNTETANLQISFDVSQKEKQIELLAKDKELQKQKLFRQRLLFAGVGVLLLLSLLGIWLLLSRNKLKQRMKELELRNQIAADLHDEVGSSLSSINMLSQMATKPGNETLQKSILEKMSTNAKETMEKMSDLVWTIKPEEAEGSNLKQRMERFAYEICGAKNINLTLQLDKLETKDLTMDQRKNMYLIFKEALNNAVKYSGTEKIAVSAANGNNVLTMIVKDEGKGFDVGTIIKGNGLENIQTRAASVGGKLIIDSAPGTGTTVKLTMPLPM